jgi:hypothetical protein
MLFAYRMTGGFTDWFAPEVLPAVVVQFLPFLFLLPLLLAAACLWPWRRTAAKRCLKWALAVFVIGIFWELLIL